MRIVCHTAMHMKKQWFGPARAPTLKRPARVCAGTLCESARLRMVAIQ